MPVRQPAGNQLESLYLLKILFPLDGAAIKRPRTRTELQFISPPFLLRRCSVSRRGYRLEQEATNKSVCLGSN